MNGPGEAGDADFGIAGGRDVGFVYAHGRVLKKVSSDILIDELFFEIDQWIAEGMHRPKRLKMAKPAALAMAEASLIPLDELGCQPLAARASQLFLPTLREDPADAEAVSHKLLVRGGFIRQVSAGLWTYLPLGWRVHRKVEQIIREEMDAIGGQEFLCPLLTPVELWEATGRDKIPEIFHVTDRNGRQFILPLTHEETFTFHAREIRSYKELPQLWYHFSVKDRDEPRPRGGLLRVREFIMKDAYSFDRDQESSEASFERNREAYHRIFDRCGVEAHEVQAESGIMGGELTFDFLAPSGSGENTLVRCERGDYAADAEIAQGVPRAPEFPKPLGKPEEVETPGVVTCEALAAVPRHRRRRDLEGDAGDDRGREGRARAPARRRPPQRVEAPLRARRSARGRRPTRRSAPRSAPPAARSARSGSTGEVVADETLREGEFVAGANRDGFHLRGVAGRPRLRAALRRHPRAARGRPLSRVRRRAAVPDRDRGRPHLQLRRQVQLAALGRDLPRRGRHGEAARSAEATESAQGA